MANPEEGAPVTDESSAVAHVASLLSEPVESDQPTEGEEGKDPPANPEVEEPGEEEPEKSGKEDSEDSDKPEPEDEDGGELPDTLDGLAEALEMSPDDLAAHLKVQVKANGEVKQVTLADAIKGHQFESDYRLKTSELAEQRRQVEAQGQQLNERWMQEAQRLGQAIQMAEALLGGNENEAEMLKLLEEDPYEYTRQKAIQDARKGQLQALQQEQQKLMHEAAERQQQNMANFRQQQQQLLKERLPDVNSPEKLAKLERNASAYLKSQGYTDQDVAGFFGGAFDHRQVMIINDAMRYRALLDGKKETSKKLKVLPKVTKPGANAKRDQGAKDKIASSKDRLRRLRNKGTKQQQTDAAVDFVKGML